MGKLYKNSITATDYGSLQYDLAQASPVDLRTILEQEEDLTNLDTWRPSKKDPTTGNIVTMDTDVVFVYPGMKVYVVDTKMVYTLIAAGKEQGQLKTAVQKFTGIAYYSKDDGQITKKITKIKRDLLPSDQQSGYSEVSNTGEYADYGWKPEGSQGLDTAAVDALITSKLLENGKIKTNLYDKGDGLESVAVNIPSNAQQLTFNDHSGNAVTPNEHTYYTLETDGEVGNIQYSAGSIFIYNDDVQSYILITDNSIGEVVSDITGIKSQLSWKDLADVELSSVVLSNAPSNNLQLQYTNYTTQAYASLTLALNGDKANTIVFENVSLSQGASQQTLNIALDVETYTKLYNALTVSILVNNDFISNSHTITKP